MDLKIFSGRSNEPLAKAIVQHLQEMRDPELKMGTIMRRDTPTGDFPDGEPYTRYGENIRNSDVFIIQSTNQPDRHLFELLVMADTAKSASAERVTAVIAYFGFGRQDQKDKSRAPVTSDTVIKLLKAVGVDRLILLDIHSEGILNAARALSINCDHLWTLRVFLKHASENREIQQFISEGAVVAAPDVNAGRMTSGYAQALHLPMVYIDKERDPASGKTRIRGFIGDCKDKNVLMVDDMIDTAGTLCSGAEELKKHGARRIFAFCAHGLFSGDAINKVRDSVIERVIVTDSVNPASLPGETLWSLGHAKVKRVSVASLLAEAIWEVHSPKGSVSKLFELE